MYLHDVIQRWKVINSQAKHFRIAKAYHKSQKKLEVHVVPNSRSEEIYKITVDKLFPSMEEYKILPGQAP